jgi:hypothetical protein
MSSRSRTKAAIAPALLLGVALAGCSDIYWDRREAVALHAGDAMATNRVTHTIDPWSRASGNREIAFNGEKMQAAAERYRTGCVIQPASVSTSSIGDTQAQAQQPAHCASNSRAASASGHGNKP